MFIVKYVEAIEKIAILVPGKRKQKTIVDTIECIKNLRRPFLKTHPFFKMDLVDDGILKSTNHRSLYPIGSGYDVWTCDPAKGIVYLTKDNSYFVSGHCRMRARPNGAYPYHYIEMIDNLFGTDEETIDVCSGKFSDDHTYTVDLNPEVHPTYLGDAQDLAQLPPGVFTRWRADPPYNQATAKSMYNCEVPNFNLLLREGMRVVRPGSLLFLLLGPTNYQIHPKGIKRIGLIFITLVPNNEVRCLNIYIKEKVIKNK